MSDMRAPELTSPPTAGAETNPLKRITLSRRRLAQGAAALAGVAVLEKTLGGSVVNARAGTPEPTQVTSPADMGTETQASAAPIDALIAGDIPALPDVPAMSDIARQFTDEVGPNNNFEKADKSTWSDTQIKTDYPKEQRDAADWSDRVLLTAKSVADTTGNSQMYDTILKTRKYMRKYLVGNRTVITSQVLPTWGFRDASDHPEKQYGVYLLHTGATKNGKAVLNRLVIRSDSLAKDYNAPNTTEALYDTMYFGEYLKILQASIDGAPEPFDANAESGSLISVLSNNIIETEAHARTISAIQQASPSFGQLGIQDTLTADSKKFIQDFLNIENDPTLNDTQKAIQKRILVDARSKSHLSAEDQQKLGDPRNNGIILTNNI